MASATSAKQVDLSLNIPENGCITNAMRADLDKLYQLASYTQEPVHQVSKVYIFLLALLRSDDSKSLGKVVATLTSVAGREAQFSEFRSSPAMLNMLVDIDNSVTGIYSDDSEIVLASVNRLREFACERNYPIGKFVDLKDVTQLRRLVTGNPNVRSMDISVNVCALLVQLLDSDSNYVAQRVVLALLRIASGGAVFCDVIIQQGCVPLFSRLVERDCFRLTDTISWCLIKLCQIKFGDPLCRWLARSDSCTISRILCAANELMKCTSATVAQSACELLVTIAPKIKLSSRETLIHLGIMSRLVTLINTSGADSLAKSALIAFDKLGPLCYWRSSVALDYGGVKTIERLMSNSGQTDRPSANELAIMTKTIANAVAPCAEDTRKVIISCMLPKLVKQVSETQDTVVLRNTVTAIHNIICVSTNHDHVRLIFRMSSLAALVSTLKNHENDELAQITVEALSGIIQLAREADWLDEVWTILDALDFVDQLERLQWHECQQLSDMAVKLMDLHYKGSSHELDEALQVNVRLL